MGSPSSSSAFSISTTESRRQYYCNPYAPMCKLQHFQSKSLIGPSSHCLFQPFQSTLLKAEDNIIATHMYSCANFSIFSQHQSLLQEVSNVPQSSYEHLFKGSLVIRKGGSQFRRTFSPRKPNNKPCKPIFTCQIMCFVFIFSSYFQ